MKAISLFSGVGGFELGFERAGIETILQAEQDARALSVLERHWPETERVNDVRSVISTRKSERRRLDIENSSGVNSGRRQDWSGIPGSVDLIYGGFPCQDLSVAGQRRGLDGERSGLWYEFHRVLSELRPRWACIENVPGLLSSNSGRDFGIILSGLDELGYAVGWAVLDAQHFGVPQRRRRVFIVCGPDPRSVASVLSLCEGCGGNPAPRRTPREEVAGTLGGGSAGNRGWANDLDRSGAFIPIAPTLENQSVDNFEIMRRTNAGVRRLTPLECERLMGWPDDHTRYAADGSEIPDSQRYRMCGNGVVATVAEWIGYGLVAVDKAIQIREEYPC